MRSIVVFLILLAAVTGLLAAPAQDSAKVGAPVHRLIYEGAITPVTSEFVVDRLDQAADEGALCLVLQLDTPGGLDSAMRQIIKAMLAAPMPVIVHVAPSGGRAASAGAFIAMAAHVAGMAPGTNIGSASPVGMGGAIADSTMAHKVTNDAAAYIASLATQRGRDPDLARRFVTEALNLTAGEALEAGLIDVIAPTTEALLDSLQGQTVMIGSVEHVLDFSQATILDRPMGRRQLILKFLADPNVAYILMMLGIYGLFFELSNPGSLVPGIMGGICLLLALFAFQALPVSYAGVGLILLGVVLLILEVKVTSFGGLTIGGVVSLVLGSLMLFDSPDPWARVSLTVIIPVVTVFTAFFLLCVWLAVRGHQRPRMSGRASLVGERGRVVLAIEGAEPLGKVVFHGEMWDAAASQAIPENTRVEVVAVQGRQVTVHPVTDDS